MNNRKLLDRLKNFDSELFGILNEGLDRQISSLSLIPTDSAASPFSSYLKGSALGNDFIAHHVQGHVSRLEEMTAKRACKLFNAEHAVVRVGNLIAASRVVLQALAKSGDTILSFNLRKKEHCSGSQMQYNFVNFSVEPDTYELDFGKVRDLAIKHKPTLIIYSPTVYPKNIDYAELRKIADEVGAKLWIDMVQNAGLVVAGVLDSPVPHADVSTFAAGDSMHGPQSGLILSKKNIADLLDKTVIETGHSSPKKNVFAALAVTFREVLCDEYKDYVDAVLENARSLEEGLKSTGAELVCNPTENHLVLVRPKPGQDPHVIEEKLARGNLLVGTEDFMTSDGKSFQVLRLSSLDPTTRSLGAEDMFTVGLTLGEFLNSSQDDEKVRALGKIIKEMVEDLPLFAEEWLPADEMIDEEDADLMMKAMVYWNV